MSAAKKQPRFPEVFIWMLFLELLSKEKRKLRCLMYAICTTHLSLRWKYCTTNKPRKLCQLYRRSPWKSMRRVNSLLCTASPGPPADAAVRGRLQELQTPLSSTWHLYSKKTSKCHPATPGPASTFNINNNLMNKMNSQWIRWGSGTGFWEAEWPVVDTLMRHAECVRHYSRFPKEKTKQRKTKRLFKGCYPTVWGMVHKNFIS